MLDNTMHVAARHEAELSSRLDPADRDTLMVLLRKLAETLDEPIDTHPGLAIRAS